jgi:hypothetical protein
MGDLSNAPTPAIQQALFGLLNPSTFSTLSHAIGGNGSAPAGPGSGPVAVLLNESAPGPGGAAGLAENLNALTQNELEGALNGL